MGVYINPNPNTDPGGYRGSEDVMKFAKPNPEITLSQMQRFTKARLIAEISVRSSDAIAIMDENYYNKITLCDILNFTINNQKRS